MGKTFVKKVKNVRKEGEYFVVRWTETEENNRSFRRRDKKLVEKRKSELDEVAMSSSNYVLDMSDLQIDGSSASWAETMERVSMCAIQAAEARDFEAQRALSSLADTVARMSAAALPHAKIGELEAKLVEATEYVNEMRRRVATENAATRHQSTGESHSQMGRTDGPEDPLL